MSKQNACLKLISRFFTVGRYKKIEDYRGEKYGERTGRNKPTYTISR